MLTASVLVAPFSRLPWRHYELTSNSAKEKYAKGRWESLLQRQILITPGMKRQLLFIIMRESAWILRDTGLGSWTHTALAEKSPFVSWIANLHEQLDFEWALHRLILPCAPPGTAWTFWIATLHVRRSLEFDVRWPFTTHDLKCALTLWSLLMLVGVTTANNMRMLMDGKESFTEFKHSANQPCSTHDQTWGPYSSIIECLIKEALLS